jgi:hypothetical protein
VAEAGMRKKKIRWEVGRGPRGLACVRRLAHTPQQAVSRSPQKERLDQAVTP